MLRQYYRIGKAIGLNVHLSGDDGWTISGCSVAINGNNLDIKQKAVLPKGLDEFSKKIKGGAPVALNLTGKGILIKKIERQEELTDTIISKLLPNAKAGDFYIQNFQTGDSSFVAMIRRAEADKWLKRLEQAGFQIIVLSLGPFVLQQIRLQLNVYESRLVADGHQVEYDQQGNWLTYSHQAENKAPFPLKIGEEKIQEQLLIPYAAAFQLALSPDLLPISAEVPSAEAAYQKKLADKQLKVNAMVVLCAVFVLLLINFALFSYLHGQNQQLADTVSRNSHDLNDVQKQSQQVADKEALVKKMGWEGNIKKSSLIDQIAQLLPPEIKWEKISIDQSLPPAPGENKERQFADKQIMISGYADRIIPVNEWMARIRTRSWVKDVQLENYTFNNELNTGQFSIRINY
jgi:Tfp pilus assembly protein PilN